MRGKLLLLCLVAAGLAGGGLGACFDPIQPGCAFSCARDNLCPEGYSCAADGLCRRTDGKGACGLGPVDGAASDSGDAAGQ